MKRELTDADDFSLAMFGFVNRARCVVVLCR